MRIAVGSDHAGYELKERVRPILEATGHEVVDVGTDSDESTDYPLYAAEAATSVASTRSPRSSAASGLSPTTPSSPR